MRHARALVLVLALFLVATAQGGSPFVIGPTGVGFSFGRGQVSGVISLGGYGSGFYGAGYSSGYLPRYTSVTVYGPAPQPIVVSPRIIVNLPPPPPEPVTDLREEDYPDKIIIRPGKKTLVPREQARPEPLQAPVPPMPGEPAGGFRPLRPEDRVPPPVPKEPEPIEPPPPWWPQLPAVPDRPAPQAADPNAPPVQQQIDLGKQAFADPHREYARGERRFQIAVETDPKNALAHFYLAQAQFALGKYREAVASIHAGLRLNPTWPLSRFPARELYGPNGEDFAEHIRLLQEAIARQPNDAALLFLYAYQLWFDGKEAEARRYFRRALPLVVEPKFIQMFLLAREGPIVAR